MTSADARPDRYVLRTVLIVALGGFLMGFDASVISGVVTFIEKEFALGKIELGWAVASLTLSATLAILFAGPLADRFGRLPVLRIAAVIFAVSALAAAAAADFATLVGARLLSGLGVGAAIVVAPMYIAEIAPPAVRGRMVTFYQLNVVLGISAAFFSNYLILQIDGGSWRWMLGIGVMPSILYLLTLWVVPESPRWLAMRGAFEQARRVLARAHGTKLAEAELAEVRAALAREASTDRAGVRELWHPRLRLVIAIGLAVGVLQQVTGINAVFFYAPLIFQQAGFAEDAAFVQAVYVGLVNLVFTCVAILLIDRLGRRPLLLFGTAGIALSLLTMAFGFRAGGKPEAAVLWGVLGFVASFAVSLGPVMWVLFSEIFPNRVRAVAISFVCLVNSAVSFLVQLVFPWELAHLGNSRTFLVYGLLALLGLAVMWRLLPETRGRSLEQLEDALVTRA